ncbi:MAG: hypothetical protein ABI068_14810 [Ktedonobacterales bacterium]
MATFRVEVLSLTTVEPHPNADRLDLAVVGNYRVVIPKGQYRASPRSMARIRQMPSACRT